VSLYRASKTGPDFATTARSPARCIAAMMCESMHCPFFFWVGTDWPHPDRDDAAGRQPTEVTPLFQIDDGAAQSAPVWRRMRVNPFHKRSWSTI